MAAKKTREIAMKTRSKPLYRGRYYRLTAPLAWRGQQLPAGSQLFYLGLWDRHGHVVVKYRLADLRGQRATSEDGFVLDNLILPRGVLLQSGPEVVRAGEEEWVLAKSSS